MNCGIGPNGKMHPIGIPPALNTLARTINDIIQSFCLSQNHQIPPISNPDMCIVNEYTLKSKLRLHDDKVTVGDRGVPVISVSLVRTRGLDQR